MTEGGRPVRVTVCLAADEASPWMALFEAASAAADYVVAAQFPSFLAGLDILVSVVPDTPATRGILNRTTLSHLGDGAHLVNIGRGSALVEDDLVPLIESGKLGGATLDVFRAEPLPSEHPFWGHPRIAVTPHVAGLTVPEDTVAQIAAKIACLERGEPVTGVVDRTKGY